MRCFLAVIILVLSAFKVQAGVISYNGYTLDESRNLVTDGVLEWLQWTETKGISVDEALNIHQSEGWRLASGEEVAHLFNTMEFDPSYVWVGDENKEQFYDGIVDTEEEMNNSPSASFVHLFGNTVTGSRTGSFGFYGLDEDNDGFINVAYANFYESWRGFQVVAGMDYDGFENTRQDAYGSYGVALVREAIPVSVSTSMLSFIFLSALLLLKQQKTLAR